MLQIDFTSAKWFEDSEGIHLSLLLKPSYRAAVKQFCLDMRNKTYTAQLKEYRPRSLNANAYFWVLCDKLAEKTNISKEEIYKTLIKNIGGNNEVVCVPDKAVDRMIEGWKHNGLGWVCETFKSKIDGCTNVVLYFGSSTYDSQQMGRLLDLVIQECEQQDIEVFTPEQISLLKEDWNGRSLAG
jgi:hypothetical protein